MFAPQSSTPDWVVVLGRRTTRRPVPAILFSPDQWEAWRLLQNQMRSRVDLTTSSTRFPSLDMHTWVGLPRTTTARDLTTAESLTWNSRYIFSRYKYPGLRPDKLGVVLLIQGHWPKPQISLEVDMHLTHCTHIHLSPTATECKEKYIWFLRKQILCMINDIENLKTTISVSKQEIDIIILNPKVYKFNVSR